MAESPDEYKRRIASDIHNAQVNQPAGVDVDEIEDEEENEGGEPQISREDIERITKSQKPSQAQTPEQQFQSGKVPEPTVPEYVYQQPGAGEPQPGGPAWQPKEKTKLEEQKEQAKDQLKEQAKGAVKKEVKAGAKQAGKAVTDAASQAAKKAAQAIAKWAVQVGAKIAAATSEYWLPILIGIIALIILIIGIVFLVRALQTPNANGSSPVQAADIISDHPLIKSILALSDPAEFQKMLSENKQALLTEISDFQQQVKTKYPDDSRTATTISQLDQVKTLISAYNTPDAAKAAAIKTALVNAVKPWATALNPGGLIYPISGFDAKHKGSGSDYGPYNSKRRNHRGIDRGVKVGTVLRAPADSEIVYLVESECRDNIDKGKNNTCNGGFGNTIIGKITAPGSLQGFFWEMHHISKNSASLYKISKGSIVKQGDIVALSGHNGSSTDPHLHFQIDKPAASANGFPVGEGRLGETKDPYEALGWTR